MKNKELEEKRVKTAINKEVPVSKIVDKVCATPPNLLVYLLVIDGNTGKVLDIVRKPGFSNNNLTVDNSVENRFEECIKYLDKLGYEAYKRK